MCNILVATPEAEDRDFLKDIIGTNFFNAVLLPEVLSIEDTYRIALEEKIEILIFDLSLSPDQAFESITKIAKEHPYMKVILLEDVQNADHLQVALRLGVIDYLVKPLKLEETQAAIHRAIISINEISLYKMETSSTKTAQDENIQSIMQYIHAHYYDENLTLDQVAKSLFLSPSYISRSFKEIVGLTFKEYLQYYRIEQAKKQLRSTSLSISDISENVGYSNLTYFSRVFKKVTSYTPTRYRDDCKGVHVPVDYYYVEQYLEEGAASV